MDLVIVAIVVSILFLIVFGGGQIVTIVAAGRILQFLCEVILKIPRRLNQH